LEDGLAVGAASAEEGLGLCQLGTGKREGARERGDVLTEADKTIEQTMQARRLRWLEDMFAAT
jgi:hypothetical protein